MEYQIIAVPTREERVDDHFGHCDHYTLFTINNKLIVAKEILPSPTGCGCKSNIAEILKSKGVSVMLAGNMGDGANNKLLGVGIHVIRGCQGSVEQVVKGYLHGFVLDSGKACVGHECSH